MAEGRLTGSEHASLSVVCASNVVRMCHEVIRRRCACSACASNEAMLVLQGAIEILARSAQHEDGTPIPEFLRLVAEQMEQLAKTYEDKATASAKSAAESVGL